MIRSSHLLVAVAAFVSLLTAKAASAGPQMGRTASDNVSIAFEAGGEKAGESFDRIDGLLFAVLAGASILGTFLFLFWSMKINSKCEKRFDEAEALLSARRSGSE